MAASVYACRCRDSSRIDAVASIISCGSSNAAGSGRERRHGRSRSPRKPIAASVQDKRSMGTPLYPPVKMQLINAPGLPAQMRAAMKIGLGIAPAAGANARRHAAWPHGGQASCAARRYRSGITA